MTDWRRIAYHALVSRALDDVEEETNRNRQSVPKEHLVLYQFSARGHEVEVAGQVTPCEDQGVRYVDYIEYLRGDSPVTPARKLECDVFVSSRDLRAVDVLRPDARLRVLWLHDVHCGPDPHAVMSRYDVVLCLSDWALQLARRFYPHVDPEKFARTRNGIDTSLYRREPRREGFQVVYSSSPE